MKLWRFPRKLCAKYYIMPSPIRTIPVQIFRCIYIMTISKYGTRVNYPADTTRPYYMGSILPSRETETSQEPCLRPALLIHGGVALRKFAKDLKR